MTAGITNLRLAGREVLADGLGLPANSIDAVFHFNSLLPENLAAMPCAAAEVFPAPARRPCRPDHRFLTPDRAVQQTRFANGVAITVNFGLTPFALPGGATVGALSHHVAGLP